MSTTEISCAELVELLTSYLEGSLEPAERDRLDEHMVGCDGCTNALTQFRETIDLTGRLTEAEVAAPEREALRAAFRRWRAEGPG